MTPFRTLRALLSSVFRCRLSILTPRGDVEHLQADAFEHQASTFLLTGDVDDSQFRPQPIEFNPSDTLPKQAKKYLMIAVGAAIGLLLVLGAASWLCWRRLRRRRIATSTSTVALAK
jgi:hypothetical protein